MKQLTAQELKTMLDEGRELQVIDVRDAGEYAAGHIPTAVNVPLDQAEARLADVKDAAVLVCQMGDRAKLCHDLLQSDRPGLMVLAGGTDAWAQAGYEVVRNQGTRWALERQVRLGAGLLVLGGVVLSQTVHPGWIWLSGFVGAGLTFAALTNICGMAVVLALMPWNKPKPGRLEPGQAER